MSEDCDEGEKLIQIENKWFKFVLKFFDMDMYLSEQDEPHLMIFMKDGKIVKRLTIYVMGSTYGGWIDKIEEA